jgi:hypothetical protein
LPRRSRARDRSINFRKSLYDRLEAHRGDAAALVK